MPSSKKNPSVKSIELPSVNSINLSFETNPPTGVPNSIAEELGSPRSANMVMLGAFTKKSNLASLSSVIEALKDTLKNKQKLIAINKKALQAGYDLF